MSGVFNLLFNLAIIYFLPELRGKMISDNDMVMVR